jgi:hypothetical protein
MIGVIVKKTEQKAAAEFFELFKTPWEFYREGSVYDVLVASEPPPARAGAAAQILFSSASLPGDRIARVFHPSTIPHWLDAPAQVLPLYGSLAVFDSRPRSTTVLYSAGQKVGLHIQEAGRDVIRIGFDLFAEIERLLVYGQPPEWAGYPTLERHIHLLRTLILSLGIPLIEIPPTPAGFAMSACLTHDVDFVGIKDHGFNHTTQGFLHRAVFGSVQRLLHSELTMRQVLTNWRAAVALPLVHLGLHKDFWLEFDRYQELEGEHPSTYFFIPYKHRPGRQVTLPYPERRAASYELASVRPHIQSLQRKGDEIALHGIDAWLEVASAQDERQRILTETGCSCVGNRIHWLCFSSPASYAVLDEAGFDYDSTCGYNETVGFKAGTCQVFQPLGAKHLLELPMHLQDVALFYPSSMGLPPSVAWRECVKVLDSIEQYGGVATILWHTRSLSPERLWNEPYARLVRDLERRKAWFSTAAGISAWFRARRQLQPKDVQISAEAIKLRMQGAPFKPGFTFRIHRPVSRGIVRQYDVPWDGNPDVRIELSSQTAHEIKMGLPASPQLTHEEVSRV